MTKCRTIALPLLRHSGFALLSLFSIRLAHRRKRDHWAVATVLWTVKSQLQKKSEKYKKCRDTPPSFGLQVASQSQDQQTQATPIAQNMNE